MRCAILRLTSRVVSPAKPRRARDSVETHAMTSRAGQGTTLLRRPPRPADGRWRPRRPPEKRCPDRSSCVTQPRGTHPSQKGRRTRRKPGGGGKRWRSPKPQQTQKTREEPTRRQGGDHHQEGEERGNHRGQGKCPGVGGPRGKQEARLFKFRGDGGKFSNGGANNVADGVVAENTVASSSAAKGMVTPAVEGLTTKTAGRVGIPKWHAQAALHRSAEKREGIWVSGEAGAAVSQAPAPGARQASK